MRQVLGALEPTGEKRHWIGFRRTADKTQHIFTPVKESCDMHKLRWSQGEPNNEYGHEYCAHYWTNKDESNQFINDVPCSRPPWFFLRKRWRM
ncbi:hypothetical protein KIN20_024376 [Parelaphostrongylus tenuis]|uniref:C-type lectin domain-containing protein n=1 Tax=Parelaphostrongylus tenuis TaxID=148309 RepID=A0AAD5N845_PARTN|nr:hypothetical protein KIN20_024376 [Parelaphostrongylus tenuis]